HLRTDSKVHLCSHICGPNHLHPALHLSYRATALKRFLLQKFFVGPYIFRNSPDVVPESIMDPSLHLSFLSHSRENVSLQADGSADWNRTYNARVNHVDACVNQTRRGSGSGFFREL